jgi:hypothetical protein
LARGFRRDPASKKNAAVTVTIVAGPPDEQDGYTVAPFWRWEFMNLTDTQKATLRIEPRNAKGNLAPVDGVPEWASSDPNVASVTPSADGLACVVKAGQAGSAQVTVTVDADLGDGIRALSGSIDVNVSAGEAVTIAIVAGAPEDQ